MAALITLCLAGVSMNVGARPSSCAAVLAMATRAPSDQFGTHTQDDDLGRLHADAEEPGPRARSCAGSLRSHRASLRMLSQRRHSGLCLHGEGHCLLLVRGGRMEGS